jgi:D-glycero-D-manno-heptose 1,7-bisphosphate phosphatase
VRLLVDGRSVRAGERMRSAALGLAARGHRVWWFAAQGDEDALAAPGVEPSPPGLAVARADAQLVLGAGRPARAAGLGWLAGTHAMVGEVTVPTLRGWSVLDRVGWQSLHSFALVSEADADEVSARPGPLSLERVGLWSGEVVPSTPSAGHLDVEILERACERSLARHRGAAPRPAVFLDRDGTLVEEVGYLDDASALRLLPGVAAGLRVLQAAGYALVLISNQAGVGRGFFPLARVYEVMARLRTVLRAEGVELDAVYFCPHRPDEGCACRKPGTELIERAEEDLQLDLRHSVMVGDKLLDVETGRRAGGRGVLVRSGYGEAAARELPTEGPAVPDHIAANFAEAARWLVEEAEAG